MAGPWYRAIPTPTNTLTCNDTASLNAAIAAAGTTGTRIEMSPGTYTYVTSALTLSKTKLQLWAMGHVLINGFVVLAANEIVLYGLELTDVAQAGTLGNQVSADDCSIINCWVHHYPPNQAANSWLNGSTSSGTLFYGCVMHDSRHVMYLQGQTGAPVNWMAHCYAGEPLAANAFLIHQYSSSSADKSRNWNYHENVFANGESITGADGTPEICHTIQFVNNRWYNAVYRHYNKPAEIFIDGNQFYDSKPDMERWHGQGDVTYGYTMPNTFTNNLIYKSVDQFNNGCLEIRTDRYGAGGAHEWNIPLLRTQDVFDNNQYYGFVRFQIWANNVLVPNITTLAAWRTATANAGKQFDTNSSYTPGPPPQTYDIWQNDYDVDRAMLIVFGYTGPVSVTLPRNGDVFEIHNQWGSPAYTGTTFTVTQNPFFGIIKYTGGSMPQFARPNTDFNNPGVWVNQAASSTNIYQAIDETVADDADYIQSPVGPTTTKVYVTKLTSITDPVSSTGHILRWRYNKDAAGGAQINLVAELRQGYVSEASQGTLIVSRSFTNVSDTFVTDAYTLSGAEADAITNYGDLYLRFTATQV